MQKLCTFLYKINVYQLTVCYFSLTEIVCILSMLMFEVVCSTYQAIQARLDRPRKNHSRTVTIQMKSMTCDRIDLDRSKKFECSAAD